MSIYTVRFLAIAVLRCIAQCATEAQTLERLHPSPDSQAVEILRRVRCPYDRGKDGHLCTVLATVLGL